MIELTQKILKKVPIKNWKSFLKKKYDADCDGFDFFIGEDADNGFLEIDTFCTKTNQTHCDVTEEEFLLIQNGTFCAVYDRNRKETIENALLEAVWISRWSQNGQGLSAALSESEAHHIVSNIFEELNKIGYEIKKK